MKISLCQIPADLIGYVRGLKRNGLYKIVIHWPVNHPYTFASRKERIRNSLIRKYAPLEGMVIRLTHFQSAKIRFEVITSEKNYIFLADKRLRFKAIVYEALRYIKLEPYEPKRLVQDKSQVIGAFLEWLLQKHEIARYVTRGRADPYTDHLESVTKRIEEWLAEYFSIDLQKIEDEKKAMLNSITQAE